MADTQDNVAYFAKTNFRNRERIFGIKQSDRRQHMYVIGQTGTGKSTLLKNMALQDIKSGKGLAIVDPHGEFVEEVLEMIPPERMGDVIYFNPADSEYPIGFNVLEVTNPKYKHLAASSLMGIFTKIWANVWSARMEYILNMSILALLDTPDTTLLGIPRILVDKEYRKKIVASVKDPVVRAFWLQEYEAYDPRFRNEAIAPIQNKVGQFLSTALIRNIVGQPKSTISVYDIMNEEKILLVNVSKGRVGEDNSALLGAMVITKIQLAAMERVRIAESERKDFYLYVDEFQNFATDSFASILSEARKYRLNLIIAHQYIGQLVTDTSTKVRDAVFGNVGTMITFRVGAADAEFLEKEFTPEFMLQDLVNLPNHHIYVKMMVDNVRSRPFSASTLPRLRLDVEEHSVEKMIESSRRLYTRGRAEVEEEISRWSDVSAKPEGSSFIKGGEPISNFPRSSNPDGNRFVSQARFPVRRDGQDQQSTSRNYQSPPAGAGTSFHGSPSSVPHSGGLPVSREQQPRPRIPASTPVVASAHHHNNANKPHGLQETMQKVPLHLGELVVKKEAAEPRRVLSLSDLAKSKAAQMPARSASSSREEQKSHAGDKNALRKALHDSIANAVSQRSLKAQRHEAKPVQEERREQPKSEVPAASKAHDIAAHKENLDKKGETIKPGQTIKF